MKKFLALCCVPLLLVACSAPKKNAPVFTPAFEPLTQLTAVGENWSILIENQQMTMHSQRHYNGNPITKVYPTEYEMPTNNQQIYKAKISSINMPATLTIISKKCKTAEGQTMPYTATFRISSIFENTGCATPELIPSVLTTQ